MRRALVIPSIPAAATRSDVLRTAERLRRAAQLLEAHAQRCTVPEAPAHAEALNQARGMVRAVVAGEDVKNP
jgi:hypothetical protein